MIARFACTLHGCPCLVASIVTRPRCQSNGVHDRAELNLHSVGVERAQPVHRSTRHSRRAGGTSGSRRSCCRSIRRASPTCSRASRRLRRSLRPVRARAGARPARACDCATWSRNSLKGRSLRGRRMLVRPRFICSNRSSAGSGLPSHSVQRSPVAVDDGGIRFRQPAEVDGRAAVNELGAELDRQGDPRLAAREHAAAETVARFEHAHGAALFAQLGGGDESGGAGAHDQVSNDSVSAMRPQLWHTTRPQKTPSPSSWLVCASAVADLSFPRPLRRSARKARPEDRRARHVSWRACEKQGAVSN